MSGEFTYEKPNEQLYMKALLKLFKSNKEDDLYRILKEARCSICPSNQFSRKRWNAMRTEVIFYIPIEKFDLDVVDKKMTGKLIDLCDIALPKESGFDVMSVEFSPDTSEEFGERDFENELENIIDGKLVDIIGSKYLCGFGKRA